MQKVNNEVICHMSVHLSVKFFLICHIKTIVVGCSLTFSCTPKDVKVHADDNGTIVLLMNLTSFIGII